jgi:hypothetical protein
VLPDRARGRRAGCGCAAGPARADLSSHLNVPSLLTRPPSWRVARRCVGRYGHDLAAAPSRESGPAPSSATQPTATRVRTLIGGSKPQSGSGLSRTCLVACAVSPVTYAPPKAGTGNAPCNAFNTCRWPPRMQVGSSRFGNSFCLSTVTVTHDSVAFGTHKKTIVN